MSHCSNNYIPEYVPPNLPWYKRDGLMTWYDQVKSGDFLKNSKQHFGDTKMINFDIIRREGIDEKVPDGVVKKYETVQDSRVYQYPKKDHDNFCPLHFAPRDLISILKRKL